MLITEIRYQRLYNITTYTHETIGLTAQLDIPVQDNNIDALYTALMALEERVAIYHSTRQTERLQEGENVRDIEDRLTRAQQELYNVEYTLGETQARLVIAKEMLDAFKSFCEANGLIDAFNMIVSKTDYIPF